MKAKIFAFANAEDLTPSPYWWEDEDFSVSLSVWSTADQAVYFKSGQIGQRADNFNVDAVDAVGIKNDFNGTTGEIEDN
jgi:hypothetical protein